MTVARLTHERAYVLGLLVAAGTISPNTFAVYLPFDQWGKSAEVLNEIMGSLLTNTREVFKSAYGIEIEPKIAGKKNTWTICPRLVPGSATTLVDAMAEIRRDLQNYGLPNSGVLLKSADLSTAKSSMPSAIASRFLTGFFDARASLTTSHRRNHLENPMVSIEMPATTPVSTVMQLCGWMTDRGSTTDQILYNHPSFHSGTDSYYLQWKKGYKIRVSASSFFSVHKFGISPKSLDLKTLAGGQNAQIQPACEDREPRLLTRCLHIDLTSSALQPPMRGSAYAHFLQACADLGCPHAPREAVQVSLKSYKEKISALSLCTKGSVEEIETLFMDVRSKYFADCEIVESSLLVSQILKRFEKLGYSELEDGMKFLVADHLYGKRALGNGAEIIAQSAKMEVSLMSLIGRSSDLLAPIMLIRKSLDRAVFLSSTSGTSNRDLLADMVGLSGYAIRLRND